MEPIEEQSDGTWLASDLHMTLVNSYVSIQGLPRVEKNSTEVDRLNLGAIITFDCGVRRSRQNVIVLNPAWLLVR